MVTLRAISSLDGCLRNLMSVTLPSVLNVYMKMPATLMCVDVVQKHCQDDEDVHVSCMLICHRHHAEQQPQGRCKACLLKHLLGFVSLSSSLVKTPPFGRTSCRNHSCSCV